MLRREIKISLITLSILIIGVVLIYLISGQFFKEPKSEITLELEEEIKEGKKMDYLAPDFELLNIKGEKNKLSDYKDKIIVLTFWTTWNPAAQDQIVILESYYQEIKDRKDIILLTISNQEDKSAVSSLIRRGEYDLPVLIDEDGRVGELYKITTLPATYLINKEGFVKEVYIGVMDKEMIQDKVNQLLSL